MSGHSVKIVHGYGDSVYIKLDKMELQEVKSFSVKGEAGRLPELTVSLSVKSVVYEQKETAGDNNDM